MAVPPPRVPRRAPPQRAGSAPRSRPPGDENGDEEISFTPRRKTVKLNPVVAIALFASPVVLAIVIGALYFNQQSNTPERGTQVETDDNVAYNKLKAQFPAAKRIYLAAMDLKDGDDQDAFGDKVNEAVDFILDLIEEYERILEPIRDEDGQVPDEFNEYMVGLRKLQLWNQDLYRSKGFYK